MGVIVVVDRYCCGVQTLTNVRMELTAVTRTYIASTRPVHISVSAKSASKWLATMSPAKVYYITYVISDVGGASRKKISKPIVLKCQKLIHVIMPFSVLKFCNL